MKKIVPELRTRILTMTEEQGRHRRELEIEAQKASIKTDKKGQWIGAGLVGFFGTIAFVLGLTGHDWLAGVIAVPIIIGVGVIFVLHKEPSNNN